MILTSADGYWSTGIHLTWDSHHQAWAAKAEYFDDGWIGDDDPDVGQICTQGTLSTRYAVHDGKTVTGLAAIIDAILDDAAGLGVTFIGSLDREPWLFCTGVDENDDSFPELPGGLELLVEQAKRIGWRTYGYALAETAGAR